MTWTKRNFKPNSFYHIYNRGNNKDAILRDPEDKKFFIQCLFKYLLQSDFRIISYCIMDNHYHLLLFVGRDPSKLSKKMQQISISLSVNLNKKNKRVGHSFQGRFNAKRLIYKRDIKNVQAYIKQNPVKEGLVKHPKDYPWLKCGQR